MKGTSSTIVDLGTYEFKDLNIGKITLKESFMNSYTEEIYESEQVHTYAKQLHTILDANFQKIKFK